MTEYTPQTAEMLPLTRPQPGLYREMNVVNNTSIPIVVVNRDDVRTVIPPLTVPVMYQIQSVVIMIRGSVKTTIDKVGNPTMAPGTTITLPLDRVRNGPIYIKEIDCVICTEVQSPSIRHPHASIPYEDGLESVIYRLTDQLAGSPGIRVLANDPSGRLTVLFTLIGDHVVQLPVMCESGEGAVVIVIYSSGPETIEKDVLDIEKLLTGTENTLEFKNKAIPWITTSEIAARAMARTFTWISPKTYESMKSDLEKEAKKSADLAEDAHNAKIKELNIKLTEMESELSQVKDERDEIKLKYNAWKADMQSRADYMSGKWKERQAENDFRSSEASARVNEHKLRNAETEPHWKLATLILGAVIPTITVITLEVLKASMKK